ncbi:MAG: hypothetical protein GF390_00675 [Candidatus Pacebacteria bacterium]|nr:hypothetical protein [Candidatus Paceibacterota bacterium]
MSKRKQKKTGFVAAKSLFANYQLQDKGGYITREFQDYGYRLAVELNDLKHKSLYIKMAKETQRWLLEDALSFVKDARARSKAKLFMWKVKQLKKTAQQQKSVKPTTKSKKSKTAANA